MSHYYFRGCVYQDAQKWREAYQDYRKSAELSSPQWEFPRLRFWLVRAHLGEREPAARDLFKRAIAREARNWRDYGSAQAELNFMEK